MDQVRGRAVGAKGGDRVREVTRWASSKATRADVGDWNAGAIFTLELKFRVAGGGDGGREYGKKKQLQALLASLHTILWPGTKWKTISMGAILQPAKVKKFYFKATLVVHPDKTGNLPADQRFLAKRIFDALSQAKTIWDDSQNR